MTMMFSASASSVAARCQIRPNRRGEAAVVLNVADLIRRRVEKFWKVQFGYAVAWPTGDGLDLWLQEIDQDVSFSGTMQDRAATIDLKTVSYAELVWLKVPEIRNLLRMTKITWENFVRGREKIPGPVETGWKDSRLELLAKCESVIGVLDALEGLFDDPVKTIDGEARSQHMARLQTQIEQAAKARAVQFVAKIDEEHNAQGESN